MKKEKIGKGTHKLSVPFKKIKLPLFYGILSSASFFIILGSISAVIPNSLFTRMTPVGFIEWGSLILTSLLIGLYIGLFYYIKKNNLGKCNLIATSGGILGFLTFGCSICNQLLILILGVSGVLTYFEPIRPILGIISIGFLIYVNYVLIKIIKWVK